MSIQKSSVLGGNRSRQNFVKASSPYIEIDAAKFFDVKRRTSRASQSESLGSRSGAPKYHVERRRDISGYFRLAGV
jgi:hypothetical protein